ncbi:MAG: AI-2E family transporter [Lachnospiraceae bacterium]|nr:AI-2E family transporter [Lachnospiraceae bacterium]
MAFYEKGLDRLSGHRRKKVSGKVTALKRPICMIAAFLTIVLLILLIFSMVVPELIGAITVLVNKVPAQVDSLMNDMNSDSTFGNTITELYDTYIGDSATLQSMIESVLDTARSGMISSLKALVGTLSSIFSNLVTIVVGFIFSIYLLLDKEHLQSQFKKLMETYMTGPSSKIFYFLEVLNDCFHNFVVGQCLEAVILGTLCAVGMLIFRFPYALMIGSLIGFTALIPVAGAYIGGAVGALMMLTDSPKTAVLFLVFLVVLQQLEGNIIYPKVVGSSIGLSGLWVLAAVTVGGGVMGIVGMLIAVPLFAAIYRIVQADMIKRDGEQ